MTASEDELEDTTRVDGADEPPAEDPDKGTDGDEAGKAKSKPKKKTPFWLELIILVVIAVALTFLIQTFVARVFSIPSESMEQTLNGCTGCVGDRILVDKLTYDFSDPSPGDVIVFKGPPGWDQNEYVAQSSSNPLVQWFRELGSSIGIGAPPEYDLVKRVIAVGGETVYCCDANNHVVINGKPIVEPYVYFQPGMANQPVQAQMSNPPANDNKVNQQAAFPTITIPQGYLLVMGDNRNNSDDSRYQNGGGQAGLVPVGNVIGKARTIIWPPSRWRGIGDYNAQVGALGVPGWTQELPLGVGFAFAFPVYWPGKRARRGIRRAAGRRTDK